MMGKETYPELHVGVPVVLHAFFGRKGFLSGDHLDEGMALIEIDNARLDASKAREDGAELVFSASENV